jgi:hypothetical protein
VLLQFVDRVVQVASQVLEPGGIAVAVADAGLIEAQCRNASLSEGACQQHELPVAAHSILRPTDHDNDTSRTARALGTMQHTDETCATGVKRERVLDRHGCAR